MEVGIVPALPVRSQVQVLGDIVGPDHHGGLKHGFEHVVLDRGEKVFEEETHDFLRAPPVPHFFHAFDKSGSAVATPSPTLAQTSENCG